MSHPSYIIWQTECLFVQITSLRLYLAWLLSPFSSHRSLKANRGYRLNQSDFNLNGDTYRELPDVLYAMGVLQRPGGTPSKAATNLGRQLHSCYSIWLAHSQLACFTYKGKKRPITGLAGYVDASRANSDKYTSISGWVFLRRNPSVMGFKTPAIRCSVISCS